MGDDIALLVDANSGFSPTRAIEVGKMLASQNASIDTGIMAIGMTVLACAMAFAVRFRRGWQPAPVFATGAGHGSDMLLPASDDHALELKLQVSSSGGEAESRQILESMAEEIEVQFLLQEDRSSSSASETSWTPWLCLLMPIMWASIPSRLL